MQGNVTEQILTKPVDEGGTNVDWRRRTLFLWKRPAHHSRRFMSTK